MMILLNSDNQWEVRTSYGFTHIAASRMLATILADILTNDVPEGVDAHAWATHYVAELWDDETVRIGWNPLVPTDVEPVTYLYAAQSLGLFTLPAGWDIDAWHPTGVHMWSDIADVVVTGWNDDDRYTVGVYWGRDHQYEEAGEWHDPLADDLIATLADIFARSPWEAGGRDRHPDPLPLPVCPATLAANYIAQVRTDLEAMANVAGAGPEYGAGYPAVGGDIADRNYHIWEIGCEVEESNNHPMTDLTRDAAALIAINTFRADLGLTLWGVYR